MLVISMLSIRLPPFTGHHVKPNRLTAPTVGGPHVRSREDLGGRDQPKEKSLIGSSHLRSMGAHDWSGWDPVPLQPVCADLWLLRVWV